MPTSQAEYMNATAVSLFRTFPTPCARERSIYEMPSPLCSRFYRDLVGIWILLEKLDGSVVEDGRLEMKLGGSNSGTGLTAALMAQFLFTGAGAAGVATCAACGNLFLPRRRPQAGENSYCSDCGIRAAWREAQRRRRRIGCEE